MTRSRSARGFAMIVLALGSSALVPFVTSPAGESAAAMSERAHVVRSGDTLSGIAKQYAVTVATLVRANRLPNDKVRLRIGTRLIVPLPSELATTPARALASTSTARAPRP